MERQVSSPELPPSRPHAYSHKELLGEQSPCSTRQSPEGIFRLTAWSRLPIGSIMRLYESSIQQWFSRSGGFDILVKTGDWPWRLSSNTMRQHGRAEGREVIPTVKAYREGDERPL